MSKYCIAYNTMVESCQNPLCSLNPCSFNALVKDLRKLFQAKGMGSTQASKVARNIMLKTYHVKKENNFKNVVTLSGLISGE